jgi:hypothetical protein
MSISNGLFFFFVTSCKPEPGTLRLSHWNASREMKNPVYILIPTFPWLGSRGTFLGHALLEWRREYFSIFSLIDCFLVFLLSNL